MKTVSIHDAKTNLSKYIEAAMKGEKIYIGGYGKPEVQLLNISSTTSKKQRNFEKMKGMVMEYSDSFSEETEKEIEELMYGN